MDSNGKTLPTQGILICRILVGGYLAYLSNSLYKERVESSMSPVALWSFIIVFTLIGLYLIVASAINLVKGRYKGGPLDVEANAEVDTEADTEVIAEAEAEADAEVNTEVSAEDNKEPGDEEKPQE